MSWWLRATTASLAPAIGNVTRVGVPRSANLAYRGIVGPLRWIAVVGVRIVRWWFGLTYIAGGVGAFIAGPIMIGLGSYGGLYMLIGGPIIVAMGWLVHPWGLQRAMNGQSLLPLRR
jgi:hypothetical protein